MGTNYYLKTNICPHCRRGDDRKHIGKSSGGWHFALHVEPENGINDLSDWQDLFSKSDCHIVDECDKVIPVCEMLRIITERASMRSGRQWSTSQYDDNHAEPGLNGLIRHKIEDRHCISHGAGTWDCIVGEFS